MFRTRTRPCSIVRISISRYFNKQIVVFAFLTKCFWAEQNNNILILCSNKADRHCDSSCEVRTLCFQWTMWTLCSLKQKRVFSSSAGELTALFFIHVIYKVKKQKCKYLFSVFCTSNASDKYLELKIKKNQGSNISVFQTKLNKIKNAHNKSSIFTRQLFFNTFSWRLKTEGWSRRGAFLQRQNLNPSKFPVLMNC